MLGNVFSYLILTNQYLILTNQIDIAEPKIYHHLDYFTRIWRLTWRVSDYEELVGAITGDGEVGLVQKYNIRVHRLCIRAIRAREANNQVSV